MNEFVSYLSDENYVIIGINNGKVNAISNEVIDICIVVYIAIALINIYIVRCNRYL